jgi:hypothetical protein
MMKFILYYRLLKTISTTISRTSSLVKCPVYLPPQRPPDFPQHCSHRRDICILNHDRISSHSALSGEYNPLIYLTSRGNYTPDSLALRLLLKDHARGKHHHSDGITPVAQVLQGSYKQRKTAVRLMA